MKPSRGSTPSIVLIFYLNLILVKRTFVKYAENLAAIDVQSTVFSLFENEFFNLELLDIFTYLHLQSILFKRKFILGSIFIQNLFKVR